MFLLNFERARTERMGRGKILEKFFRVWITKFKDEQEECEEMVKRVGEEVKRKERKRSEVGGDERGTE